MGYRKHFIWPLASGMAMLVTACGGATGSGGGSAVGPPAPSSTVPTPTPSATSGAIIKRVFVIAIENINWTQPSEFSLAPQLLGNEAAPFINSLVTKDHPNAAQVSYATKYLTVVTNGLTLHPSEPNYVWAEAGVAGPLDDADPYPANVVSAPSLSAALAASGRSWRSYQEDIDLALNSAGQVTNTMLPEGQWTVPLRSLSGISPAYINPYNGSRHYDYAAKHNPQVFFAATNGGTSATPDFSAENSLSRNHVPLARLADDLRNSAVADYNWITPDQFNDMHTALPEGFPYQGKLYTGDQARIAQGDNFLAQVVPLIMASQAYRDGGAIIIWTDETEGETSANRGMFTAMEVVISPLGKGNAYANRVVYDHTSDLLTMMAIFGVPDFRRVKTSAADLSDFFQSGAIPSR